MAHLLRVILTLCVPYQTMAQLLCVKLINFNEETIIILFTQTNFFGREDSAAAIWPVQPL